MRHLPCQLHAPAGARGPPYVLHQQVRKEALQHTPLAQAQPGTVIVRLFKIAALVKQYTDPVTVQLPLSCTVKHLLWNVTGRKTDVGDAHWLATLACAGLLRASFVAPAAMRELRERRLITRQRQKLAGHLAGSRH